MLFATLLLVFEQPLLNPTAADVSLLQRIIRYCSVYCNMRSQNGCHNIPARFPSYVILISSFIVWKCILWRVFSFQNHFKSLDENRLLNILRFPSGFARFSKVTSKSWFHVFVSIKLFTRDRNTIEGRCIRIIFLPELKNIPRRYKS
jgi:hypothetical protein